ncbi:hypothetical protein Hanom_Chr05g00389121 [Helianthus anomalus]
MYNGLVYLPFYVAPAKTPKVFDLEELDSYFGPVQVKQEVNPKPTVTSKPTSSKTATVPSLLPLKATWL